MLQSANDYLLQPVHSVDLFLCTAAIFMLLLFGGDDIRTRLIALVRLGIAQEKKLATIIELLNEHAPIPSFFTPKPPDD